MAHETRIVKGSTKRSETGGVEWRVNCCGSFEASGHIQNPGHYTVQELKRLQQDHLAEVQKAHEDHEAAIAFLMTQEGEK